MGQVKVDDKSNEITAIPKRLKMLDLTGATVTIDAMGCQKEMAKVITAQGADYVLALKDNHSTLCEDVTLFFEDGQATEFAETDHDYYETVDGDHGRIETPRYWITSDIEWLGATTSWSNLHSIGMVESRREVGEEIELETRYFLCSLPADGVCFAQAVRQHWGIENALHWVLDVTSENSHCLLMRMLAGFVKTRAPKPLRCCVTLRSISYGVRHRISEVLKPDASARVGTDHLFYEF